MTFNIFKAKIDEIAEDFSPVFRPGIATYAHDHLRDSIAERREIRETSLPLFNSWTEAEDADFSAAAQKLDADFKAVTNERVQVAARFKGASIACRPSAVWVEGKTFRTRLVLAEAVKLNQGLVYQVKATDFCKVAIWGWKHPDTKQKLQSEHPSEYLAHRAMRAMFEKAFGVKLDG